MHVHVDNVEPVSRDGGERGREKNEDTRGEEGMGFTDDRTNVFE